MTIAERVAIMEAIVVTACAFAIGFIIGVGI